jgi:hypothetical protein
MRVGFVLLLLAFWCYLAFTAFQRGDGTRAVVYLVIGLALTAYRLGVGRRRAA